MNSVKEINKRIEMTKTLLDNLFVDRQKAYSRTFMKCKACGEKSKVGNSYIIRYEWYDDNTGSPCGGYYTFGGYYFGCPKCYHYWMNEIEEDLAYQMNGSFKREITVRGEGQYFELEEE